MTTDPPITEPADDPPPAPRRRGIARRSGAAVSPLELFFDLVFVFAVTQVSHRLLEHLTWQGAAEAAMLLLVVWWSWNYTTWATNELDPERPVVRMLLLGLMFASLLMSIAIPDAFGDRALLFVGAYVAIQVGRHSFLAFAAAERGTPERERAARILTWFVVAGVFWIAGGLADGTARTVLWIIALLIDYGGPLVFFWVPGRVRLHGGSWDVTPAHMAERFQLFVIIALGESIVITGATVSGMELDARTVLALVLAFVSAAAFWWLYFASVAEIASSTLAEAGEQSRAARDIYTYLHVVLVAGIVLSAVGDEVVLHHVDETLKTPELIALVAGPVVYLLAQDLMRLRIEGSLSSSRSLGIVACLAIGVLGTTVPAWVVGLLLTLVLVSIVVRDELHRRSRAARGAVV
jgi:low temperature requirement protein LtrA